MKIKRIKILNYKISILTLEMLVNEIKNIHLKAIIDN